MIQVLVKFFDAFIKEYNNKYLYLKEINRIP